MFSTCTDLPFGDALSCTIGGPGDIHFTAQEQDAASVTHFMYRNYSTTQGRWFTTDPAGLAAVNPTNPQSWNRYAYVMNNPVSYTDPTGLILFDCGDEGDCSDNGGDYSGSSSGFSNPGNPSWDPGGQTVSWFWGQGYGDHAGCSPEFEICNPIVSIVTPTFGSGGGGSVGVGGTPTSPVAPWMSGSPGFGMPCDFGVCNPIADGLEDTATLGAAVPICAVQPELCVVAGIIGIGIVVYGPEIIKTAKDTIDWTSQFSKCLNQFIQDTKACEEAYPQGGPALDRCYKAAKQKFDLCRAGGTIQ